MASGRPTTGNDDNFPTSYDYSKPDTQGAPSVISSRLSDDGGEAGRRPPSMTSKKSMGGASRPDTAKTAGSSKSRPPKTSATNRMSYTSKRDSMTSTNEPNTRTRSLMSKSHVPSLTSNAFFRPMSSQKLQAHRGASRPTTMSQQQQQQAAQLNLDDGATDHGGSVMPRQSTSSNPPAGLFHVGIQDDNMRSLPSRGTEMTEDQITANTSPTTGGYHPSNSLSDSVRPLHKSPDLHQQGLSINTDKSYQDIGKTAPSPVKSPRSFRSSFLLSGRESGQAQNRSTEGAEKLSSGASSPKLGPMDGQRHPRTQSTLQNPPDVPVAGRVFEYFEGNTRFFLGGRWQNTKGRPINIATGVFIAVPCLIFFASSAPWLWHNVSPGIPLTFAYLTYICISSFIHASVSDPGVSVYRYLNCIWIRC